MLIVGVDRVKREYSVLNIPKQDDPNAELVLLEGEERHPLSRLTQKMWHGMSTSDGGMEGPAIQAHGFVGFCRFLQGHYLAPSGR